MVKKRRKRGRRVARRTHRNAGSASFPDKRTGLVIKNLIVFLALALVSLLLSKLFQNLMLVNLFSLLSIIFAFLAVAFLLVLLIFLILKIAKKR
jgi:hypothetical protein